MATLLIRPAEGGSGDKKRRARKGKNAQKKQPQRGLGVAQLEKLRLQEQSLLCPASPSAYSLRLCANPSDHPMVRCDSDVAQTILSLATSNMHAQGGGKNGVVRGGEAGAVSRLSTLSGPSSAQSCLSPSVVQERNKSDAEAVDAAMHAAASRAFGCLSQSSRFSSANASFFSNVLTSTQLQMLDNQAQAQQKLEERKAVAAGDQSENASSYTCPTVNNHGKEAAGSHLNDAGFKLHPMFKNHVQDRIPLNLFDPHYRDKQIEPDHVPYLPSKRIELPVAGISPNIDKTNSTKELSSFQSYPCQQSWSTPDKVGRKRPWLALQESTKHACHAQGLDLNTPAGNNERHSPPRLMNQASENRVGAHYTTGIVRNALGKSCLTINSKTKGCSSLSPWQDNESPSPVSAYFSDVGVYPENGNGFRYCPSQYSIKDSCSSATGSSTYFTLNRKRCLTDDPETPFSLAEKESICSNFLTLGISSSSNPDRSGWNEPEESIQDNSLMSSNDVNRLKQQDSMTSGCEGDNHASQIRKSGCKQEGVYLEGGPTRCFSLDYGGGNYKRKTSMLLCDPHIAIPPHHSNRFPSSLPPPFMASTSNSPGTAHQNPGALRDPSTIDVLPVEGILDLRLKL